MAGRIAKLPHFNASGDEWLSVNYVKEISNTINLIAKVDLIILGTLKEQIFQALTKLALSCVSNQQKIGQQWFIWQNHLQNLSL